MKVSFKDSQYEKDIEAQEQLIENRRKGILAKSDYYTQMSHHQQNAMGSIHNYDRYSALN
jgi:hypothetical protein